MDAVFQVGLAGKNAQEIISIYKKYETLGYQMELNKNTLYLNPLTKEQCLAFFELDV